MAPQSYTCYKCQTANFTLSLLLETIVLRCTKCGQETWIEITLDTMGYLRLMTTTLPTL